MNVQVEIDIEALVKEYEAELGHKLTTWKERMEAVAEGAIDADDAQHFASVCAAIADEALDGKRLREMGDGQIDLSPTWDYVISSLWSGINSEYEVQRKLAVENYVKCGEVADWWLAEKAKK